MIKPVSPTQTYQLADIVRVIRLGRQDNELRRNDIGRVVKPSRPGDWYVYFPRIMQTIMMKGHQLELVSRRYRGNMKWYQRLFEKILFQYLNI